MKSLSRFSESDFNCRVHPKRHKIVKEMTSYDFGNQNSSTVLIQPITGHELGLIKNEVAMLQALTGSDFCLIAVIIDNWNIDLSPWNAPAVFGNEAFGAGAADTLNSISEMCNDTQKSYCLGGYSLAGLFSLWAAFQTDLFNGIAAVSPSVWFPGFTDYITEQTIKTDTIYLSLGNKEDKTKNPVMKTVGDRIRQTYDILKDRNVDCTLEWNEGNHFKDVDKRCARAFSWILSQRTCSSIQKSLVPTTS